MNTFYSLAPEEFLAAPGAVGGWECGNSPRNATFPGCPVGGQCQLSIRYQAPSRRDGLHLGSPDHKSHMAYLIGGHGVPSHPVAVPMIEFKMAFPAGRGRAVTRARCGSPVGQAIRSTPTSSTPGTRRP